MRPLPSLVFLSVLALGCAASSAPAPKAPKPGTWTITGKALLPGGKPAAGAHVWVGWDATRFQGGFAEGTAGDGGDFKVALRADRLSRVVIGGAARGWAPTWRVVKLPALGKPVPPVSVTLFAPVTLSGKLVRLNGSPATGIRLDVSEVHPVQDPGLTHLIPAGVIQKLGGRSGMDGRFRLTGLPPRCDVTLAPGSDVLPVEGSVPQFRLGPAGVEDGGALVVARPGSIQALVQTPQGQPAFGTPLRLRRVPPPPSGRPEDRLFSGMRSQFASQVAPVEMEPNGLARVDNLAPGHYELAARGRSYPIEVPEGGIAGPIKITTRAEPFSGAVTDADGKPAGRARVEVWAGSSRAPWPPSPDQPALTKENGTFETTDFPWSAATVTVRAVSGNGLAEWRGDPAAIRGPLALKLQPRALVTLAGKLRGVDGTPLPGVNVAVFTRDGSGPRAVAIGQADAEGSFSITGVPRGLRVALGTLENGLPVESAFHLTPEDGEQLYLGEVKLSASTVGLSAPDDMARALLPAAIPSTEELEAARQAAWTYLQAVRASDLKRVQALSAPATPGVGTDLAQFLQFANLRLPQGADRLTLQALHPLTVTPRLTYLYLLNAGEERESLVQTLALLDQPEWATVGYRAGSTVNILAVLHKEAGGWNVLGGLQSDLNSTATVSGDASLFGVPYPAPPAEPVLARAREYLAAWSRGAHAELWKWTSPHAAEYDLKAESFLKKWADRPDNGMPPMGLDAARPELDHRFDKWDLNLLMAYPQMLARVRAGKNPASPGAAGYPRADVQAGNVAAVRYQVGGSTYLMLLHRRSGNWEVVEPALKI